MQSYLNTRAIRTSAHCIYDHWIILKKFFEHGKIKYFFHHDDIVLNGIDNFNFNASNTSYLRTKNYKEI